jgi:hypothetical protein
MTTGAPGPFQPPPGGAVPAAPKPADPARSAAIILLVSAALLLVGTISKNWVTAGDTEDRMHAGPMGAEVCLESRCVEIPLRGVDKDIEIIMTLAMLAGFAAAGVTGVFGGMVFAGSRQVPVPTKLANLVLVIALIAFVVFLGRMLSEKANISWAGFVAIGGAIVGFVGLKAVSPFLKPVLALPAGAVQPYPQHGSQPYQQGNPYANQSQPMQPQHGSQPYQQQPQHGSQPYQMQQQPQHGSQPYQQPMQGQPQYGSQPHQMPQPPQQQMPNCPRCGTQLQFVAQYQRWFCPREQQYV